MANKTLLDIHKQMVESEALLGSGIEAQYFIKAATDVITPALQKSQEKMDE